MSAAFCSQALCKLYALGIRHSRGLKHAYIFPRTATQQAAFDITCSQSRPEFTHAKQRGSSRRAQRVDAGTTNEPSQIQSNKPQDVLINKETYKYLLANTTESEALASLRERTAAQYANAKQMQVSPEQGRYLSWLAGALGAGKAIEVGVFTGYSAICIAQALLPTGFLLACEMDTRPLELARKAFAEAGVDRKIKLRVGKAMDALQELLDNSYHDQFDMAFVDADKRGYWQYHEKLLKLVRRGGVLVYDNMLWYGAVADPEDRRKSTVALRKFGEQLQNDPRVDVCLVPIGDGMALCRRL